MDKHSYFTVTGSRGARQSASHALDSSHRVGYGRPAIDYLPYDALLCTLDAPTELPAGSMNSVEWVNGRGEPSPSITTTAR